MHAHTHTHTRTHGSRETIGLQDTHTHIQPFNGLWSGTTRVGQYQKEHSPTHTLPDLRTSSYQLSPFTTIHSILFVQFTCLTVVSDNLSPGPLWSSSWSWTSTSYSMHFFTQSSYSFRSTCPYQRSLFCCNTNAMSSIPSLSSLIRYTAIISELFDAGDLASGVANNDNNLVNQMIK